MAEQEQTLKKVQKIKSIVEGFIVTNKLKGNLKKEFNKIYANTEEAGIVVNTIREILES